ncbi:MAG: hypothetical protein U9P14_02210 [Gemmatimonadota bacterium]|nr:hypothetical protein [Gemmatimonadota bacterium]
MNAEMLKILITLLFVIILVIMFVWLVKALMPSYSRSAKEMKRDDFDQLGYETMSQIQRKERSVMVVGVVVVIIILGLMGALIYFALATASFGDQDMNTGFNILLAFLPAIVLLVLIVKASQRYMKVQQYTLGEFHRYKTKRAKAMKEYQKKRLGADSRRSNPSLQIKTSEEREVIKKRQGIEKKRRKQR